MISLAAEGGYQVFKLGSSEWFWLIFSAGTALLALAVGLLPDARGPRRRPGHAQDDRDRHGHPGRRDGLPEAPVQDDRRHPRPARDRRVRDVDRGREAARGPPLGSQGLTFAQSGLFRTLAFIAGCLMSGLTGFIGMSLAVRGNVRTAAAAKSGSLPAALKVAFRTGGVAGMFTVGPRPARRHDHHHDLPEHRLRRSSSASGSVARCSRCSCASAAASSPRRPTSAPTSSARSRRASPKTTPATRPPSPTTWATTWATAPAWPPTSSRATRSRWSRRSSSASPRSSRSA